MDKVEVRERIEYLEGRTMGLVNAITLIMDTLPDNDQQRLRRAISAAADAGISLSPGSPRSLGIRDVARSIVHPLK